MYTTRNPQNRIKNWTGTVHFAGTDGRVACGPIATANTYQRYTVEDVTCIRCIAKFGADEITGQTDPTAPIDENIARRAAERAARRAAR